MKTAIVFLALVLAATAGAEEKKSALAQDDEDKNAPLQVTSEQMVTDNKRRIIVFTGDVEAVKGKLTVKAEKMTVWTTEDHGDFTDIEAEGNVVITKGEKTALGAKAHYYADEKKIVMTGDPVLRDGKNTAKGERVIYFFDRDDMVIVGGEKQRSTVTLFPKKKTEEKKEDAAANGSRQQKTFTPKPEK